MAIQNEFVKFNLSTQIVDALTILKMHVPTPIQEEVIPRILGGEHVIAKSQTGSGKTAAFGIPICEMVTWDVREPQALVLEPTRELTVQVKQELYFIGRHKRLKVADVFGGFPIDKQIQTLRQKNHIVVGTPGRVEDHIRRESLKLERIKYLVIDEADLMLDMGFAEEVRHIVNLLPADIQICLLSATMTQKVQALIRDMNKEATFIEMEADTQVVDAVTQKLYKVDADLKYKTFLDVLAVENPDSAMIFCGTRDMVDILGHKLQRDQIKVAVLHGEIDQAQRLKAIDGFKAGRYRYLIATDVASRGVDVAKLSHVFNYDFPTGKETYVHRIGRTGRNGATGIAVSIVTPDDEAMHAQVEAYIKKDLVLLEPPIASEEVKKAFKQKQQKVQALKKPREAGFHKLITKLVIGGGKKSKLRTIDIVGTICSIEGMTAEDIGAIDIRDSLTYVEILHGKGELVRASLQEKTIKGKVRKVRIAR
ncbi:MAG: DEAD/DEAH box helicase [Lachnospiraceae bacterium]